MENIETLPANLRNNVSYAVVDQVRTLNASRFYALKGDNGEFVEAEMPEDKMIELYKAVIRDLLRDVPSEELGKIFL